MTRAGVVTAAGGTGALLALSALVVLHHALLLGPALAVGVLTAGAVVVLRGAWSHLPPYIGLWLDLGVGVATSLLASVGHAAAAGVPFMVLRAPELGLLTSASLLVALATTGLAYTHLRLAEEVEAQHKRVAELERTTLQSRLSVLSAQIHPHFLFNTLNTLAELVHEDAEAAEDLVTDLAAMMRTTLRGSTGPVPLTEELALVRHLLRIESARLGHRLQWSITGVEALAGTAVEVPGLSIQPLVENAVKYAAAARREGGRVDVSVRVEADRVHVEITDDGPGLPPAVADELRTGVRAQGHTGTEGHGGGLRNCVERLRLTFPDGSAALRHATDRPGTCLVVQLPLASLESP